MKTDKKGARGIAQLMRLGWFRPVHCKSLPAQVSGPQDFLQGKLHDLDMRLRGICVFLGLRLDPTPRTFAARIRELAEGHPTLATIASSL